MSEFEAWVEPRLAEFGELGTITDWAGKLVGGVGRIAGILHMASQAGEPAPWDIPVPGETMEHAIAIGKYLIPHAKAAFAEMGMNADQDHAKRILRWIENKSIDRFTKRDVHQSLKGTFKRVEDLDAPLRLLESHEYVAKRPEAQPTGAGRPPSPVFDVNPNWITAIRGTK